MNYIISFVICIISSISAVLSGYPDYKWLFVSDANVALFLFLAWALRD